jgi:hypothetical protein
VNLFFKIIGIFTLLQFGISCSCFYTSNGNSNYHIDYSTGGGFTGIESGITISSDHSVKYWEKKVNSSRTITDSTELTSVQIDTFNELLKSKEIFTYKNDYRGNYTARLTFVNNGSSNNFSFNPSDIPKDMPEVLKSIIAEIKKINSQK